MQEPIRTIVRVVVTLIIAVMAFVLLRELIAVMATAADPTFRVA